MGVATLVYSAHDRRVFSLRKLIPKAHMFCVAGLYDQIRALVAKQEALKAEIANDKTETPEQQRTRLTEQVRCTLESVWGV